MSLRARNAAEDAITPGLLHTSIHTCDIKSPKDPTQVFFFFQIFLQENTELNVTVVVAWPATAAHQTKQLKS